MSWTLILPGFFGVKYLVTFSWLQLPTVSNFAPVSGSSVYSYFLPCLVLWIFGNKSSSSKYWTFVENPLEDLSWIFHLKKDIWGTFLKFILSSLTRRENWEDSLTSLFPSSLHCYLSGQKSFETQKYCRIKMSINHIFPLILVTGEVKNSLIMVGAKMDWKFNSICFKFVWIENK